MAQGPAPPLHREGALIATATSGPNAAVLTALGVAIAVGGLATLTSPSSRSARWT